MGDFENMFPSLLFDDNDDGSGGTGVVCVCSTTHCDLSSCEGVVAKEDIEEERRLVEHTVFESKSVMTVEIVVALGEDELESLHGVMTVLLPSPVLFMRGVVAPIME